MKTNVEPKATAPPLLRLRTDEGEELECTLRPDGTLFITVSGFDGLATLNKAEALRMQQWLAAVLA